MLMLKFWISREYEATHSLPLLLVPLWSGVVVPIKFPPIGQIDPLKNYSYPIVTFAHTHKTRKELHKKY